MAKPNLRKRIPGKSTRKVPKKKARTKRKISKQKQKQHKAKTKAKDSQVNALADRLASSTSVGAPLPHMEAAEPGPGSRRKSDANMETSKAAPAAPTANREDLRKKLRAKLAGHSLDRTQGLEKGKYDSSGLKKRDIKSRKAGMDMS
eukprot:TRINITY_DN65956_c0_g1_i1.p1 TRINITY_DN65956_c0_g1~~TRINITY_DN65956_c0_g1_i1.p1  ORF type:complete len:168 (-),score=41.04 TRINITY_DN65956_c0_g1_i1:149-589(-)